MNKVLENSINKAESDYVSLREFTENASHELQTPLAIIRSKLDLIVQYKNLNEEQNQALISTYASIKKLKNLGKSLLLLTKIENNQFQKKININIKRKVEEKLLQFEELLTSKNISSTTDLAKMKSSLIYC
jgi:signal transduction histidine kinase